MKRSLLLLVSWGVVVIFAACEDDSSNATPEIDGGTLAPFDAGQTTPPTPDDAGSIGDAGNSDAPVTTGDAQASSGALKFDGLDDLVIMSPADGGPSETAFSVELWFKTTSTAGPMFTVFATGGGADRMLFTQGGKVCFYVYGPAFTVCSTIATYNDNTWHHAAATLGAVGGQKVFVDGVLAGTNPDKTMSTFTAGNRISIANGPIAFNGPVLHYAGEIDDIRMWSVERSEAEIAANRRVILPGSTPGLQDYWRFDETGAATTAHDEVTDPHDGTLGGFMFTPTSPWVGPGAF